MLGNSVYIIGSLRNENIPKVAASLREVGLDVFDDWYSAGKDADDYLRDYYRERGMKYSEVLSSYSARHIFEFDKKHLDRCDCAVLVLPAGKSGHLELGYVIGKGKPGYILMDGEPERVDIMHSFATKVFMNKEEMIEHFTGTDVQSGSGKTPSLSSVRGDAKEPDDDLGGSLLRGTEVRGTLVEEGIRGKVQGRKVSTSSGGFFDIGKFFGRRIWTFT